MRIAEIFYSVQGEGMWAGVPSVFVRSSGCNLRCSWCDTPYASWKPEGRDWGVEEVLEAVRAYVPARHVVFTGGEPMLVAELPEMTKRLRAEGWHITIETAGTVAPEGIACDLASLSPKLAHSTPWGREAELGAGWIRRHEATRLQPEVLRAWQEGYVCQWKFVVANTEADLREIEGVLAEVGGILPHTVLLMPEGTEAEGLRAKSLALVELCKARGYRFCDRLHVHLYGHRRGT